MNFYGEFETDKAIRSYFPDLEYKGTFIEVGAARPDFISLSRHFKENGWTTVGVEANPDFAELHRAAGNRIVQCALSNYIADNIDFQILIARDWSGLPGGVVTMEAASALKPYAHVEVDLQKGALYKGRKIVKVNVRTLDYLFENQLSDIKKVDVMSIDVEGGELDVLRGFTKKELYPSIFVIECPYENRGPEETAVLGSLGYTLVQKHSYNHFYMKA